MGSEEFVRRADQEVASQGLHVNGSVRGVLYGIHVYQGSGSVRHGNDLAQRVDGPQGVGGVTHRKQARPVFQGFLQVVQIQGAILGVKIDPAHVAIAIMRCHHPGRDIGIVIQASDHDLVAGLPGARQRTADIEGQAGHIGPEDDGLWARCIDEVGQGLACLINDGVRGLAGGESAPVVGVVLVQVSLDTLQAAACDLRAAGVIQKDCGVLQRRKLVANLIEVEGHNWLRD